MKSLLLLLILALPAFGQISGPCYSTDSFGKSYLVPCVAPTVPIPMPVTDSGVSLAIGAGPWTPTPTPTPTITSTPVNTYTPTVTPTVTPTPWTNINGNTINVGNFTPQIVPTTQLMSGSVSVTGIGPSTVAVWLNAGASIIIAPSYTYTPTLTPISSYTPTVTPTVTPTPTSNSIAMSGFIIPPVAATFTNTPTPYIIPTPVGGYGVGRYNEGVLLANNCGTSIGFLNVIQGSTTIVNNWELQPGGGVIIQVTDTKSNQPVVIIPPVRASAVTWSAIWLSKTNSFPSTVLNPQ